MCGRYFWTDDAEDAFEEDFPELAGEAYELRAGDDTPGMRAGDYTPGMKALAVIGKGSSVHVNSQAENEDRKSSDAELGTELLQWGFPGFDKGKLLINARAENVKDRPTFADSYAERRCVLPAAGFYEWDKKKEKVTFTVPENRILYLAGIYRPYGEEKRFVVLTREANASMAPVHDRMPLILSRAEVWPWVNGGSEADDILAKVLPLLKAERPYEQMTFEW